MPDNKEEISKIMQNMKESHGKTDMFLKEFYFLLASYLMISNNSEEVVWDKFKTDVMAFSRKWDGNQFYADVINAFLKAITEDEDL